MLYQLIYSCTCFLLLINTTIAFNLSKRQGKTRTNRNKSLFFNVYIFLAVASRSCGNENNTISICSPTFDSIWMNDTDQEITWKWK